MILKVIRIVEVARLVATFWPYFECQSQMRLTLWRTHASQPNHTLGPARVPRPGSRLWQWLLYTVRVVSLPSHMPHIWCVCGHIRSVRYLAPLQMCHTSYMCDVFTWIVVGLVCARSIRAEFAVQPVHVRFWRYRGIVFVVVYSRMLFGARQELIKIYCEVMFVYKIYSIDCGQTNQQTVGTFFRICITFFGDHCSLRVTELKLLS